MLEVKKRLQKVIARASEKAEETVARMTQKKMHMARTRASETAEETVARQAG